MARPRSTSPGWRPGRLDAHRDALNLPWDVSGGALLVREGGGRVYDHDGSPHSPSSRFTLASTAGLVDPVIETLKASLAAVG